MDHIFCGWWRLARIPGDGYVGILLGQRAKLHSSIGQRRIMASSSPPQVAYQPEPCVPLWIMWRMVPIKASRRTACNGRNMHKLFGICEAQIANGAAATGQRAGIVD